MFLTIKCKFQSSLSSFLLFYLPLLLTITLERYLNVNKEENERNN
jgi:hypothetical protein